MRKKKYIRNRLRKRMPLDNKFVIEEVVTTVVQWLRDCAKQAAKNGFENASDVIDNMATHLEEDLI